MMKRYRLREVLTLQYGKALPDRDRVPGKFPVYGSGGIGGYHNKPLVHGPGIIVGRKGSIGNVFLERRSFYPIDTTYYVEPKEELIDFTFTYYLLLSLPLASMNSDAAVPGLNRDRALDIEISLPVIDTQRRIASILSAYDDLIENNTRRITILEEMARRIYEEWFVRFRFPGHESVRMVESELGLVPDGWRARLLGDEIELAYGKALKAEERKVGDVPVYGSSGIVGQHNASLVNGPGIIVGRKGNVGSVHWSETSFFPIDTVYFVKTMLPLHFVYFNLQRQNFLNNDAAVPGLNRNQAYALPLLLPSNELLAAFDQQCASILGLARLLANKNANLRTTRDLLLPNLISGALDVSALPEPDKIVA
jgi:type I restriction enzyme S subunit